MKTLTLTDQERDIVAIALADLYIACTQAIRVLPDHAIEKRHAIINKCVTRDVLTELGATIIEGDANECGVVMP